MIQLFFLPEDILGLADYGPRHCQLGGFEIGFGCILCSDG